VIGQRERERDRERERERERERGGHSPHYVSRAFVQECFVICLDIVAAENKYRNKTW